MKKLILFFLLFFLLITDTSALSKFYIGEKVPNMYIEEYDDNNFHNGAPFVIKRDDGSIVYCINPFLVVNTSNYYYEYNYNDKIFNLTDEQLDRINVIAYYGYNYYNHNDIKWYGITQFLIWKSFKFNDIYFTDSYYGNKINAYEEEIAELENLVNNHYLLPSFASNHYEYDPNTTYTLIDNNNVLYKYEILETNIDAKIVNNNLTINTSTDGIYEIKFVKKSPVERNFILYNFPNAQSLFYPGNFKDIIFNLTIEVNSGEVFINKFDSEGKMRVEATLEGATYGIYNTEFELIDTIVTDESGVGYIDNLSLGQYYIKEISPSPGYELDTNTYYFTLTKENKHIEINSYENVIEGNLIINKYYGEDDNYSKEDGAIFEIYDSNYNLIDTCTTLDGNINKKLEYGDYYLIQKQGISGYRFIDRFNISIRENKNYIFDLYDEKEILVVEVPNTLKYDYNKFISIALILVGLIIIVIEKVKEFKEKTTDY